MNDLLRFPAPGGSADSSFDVSDVMHEVCETLDLASFRRGVNLDVDAPPYTILYGDRDQFRTALHLLLTRVLEVVPRGSDIVVSAYGEDHGVEVEVADAGTGIAHALPQSLLDFGRDEQSSHTQAFAEVRRVIAALGGELKIHDDGTQQAVITVHFPEYLQRAAA